MSFAIDERAPDTPFVQTIWRTQSGEAGQFTSVAVSRCEMVVMRQHGETTVVFRGPETKASRATVPPDAEFLGIAFEHGAFLPDLPPESIVDGGVALPRAGTGRFWLNGRAWQVPTFENADIFVRRLVRAGTLVVDPVVVDTVAENTAALSPRSLRRRCLKATGLTPGLIRQIDRARQAAALLQQGVSVLDTVELTGYADQPHLTRSLKRFMGHTPAAIARAGEAASMSLLYKTREFRGRY